jgi:hypothetical protein
MKNKIDLALLQDTQPVQYIEKKIYCGALSFLNGMG